MNVALKSLIDTFFKDKHGKWAIMQFPNILLTSWIVLTAASFFLQSGAIGDGIKLLQSSVLFAWAYNEAVSGLSYFRRSLGVVFVIVVVLSYFLR